MIIIKSVAEESLQASGQSTTGHLEQQPRRNPILAHDDEFSQDFWYPKELMAVQEGLLEIAHHDSILPDLACTSAHITSYARA